MTPFGKSSQIIYQASCDAVPKEEFKELELDNNSIKKEISSTPHKTGRVQKNKYF